MGNSFFLFPGHQDTAYRFLELPVFQKTHFVRYQQGPRRLQSSCNLLIYLYTGIY